MKRIIRAKCPYSTFGKNGIEAPLNNGFIKGLIDTIQEVEDVKEMLNKLVNTMADEVNKLHRSGKQQESPGRRTDFLCHYTRTAYKY